MEVDYTPKETQTYTVPERFTATWSEGNREYRLIISGDTFELGQWDNGGLQYTRSMYPNPSAKKILEAVEKYKSRLDITP